MQRSVKTILITTAVVAIGAAIVDLLLYQFGRFVGLQFILSLSALFWNSYFLWQPVTYLFVLQPTGGLDLPFFFSLFFQFFAVWVFGNPIAERFGNRSFLKLYLFSGMVGGLLALAFLGSGPYYSPISGPMASLFALLTVWAMMHPEGEILLYFLFPLKTKWLLAAGLGISALVAISSGTALSLARIVGGTLSGYLYGVLCKDLSSPFIPLLPIDRWLRKRKGKKAEIVPFQNKEESDEAFLDRVLEKISKKGKSSLTKSEQKRLDRISRSKSGLDQ